jgi:hypothetical protein
LEISDVSVSRIQNIFLPVKEAPFLGMMKILWTVVMLTTIAADLTAT